MSSLIPLPAPFDGLPLSDLPRRSLTGGEHLFHQGDRARGMFFVEQGEVRLVRHTEAGQLVTMFRQGQATRWPSRRYSATTITVTPSLTGTVPFAFSTRPSCWAL